MCQCYVSLFFMFVIVFVLFLVLLVDILEQRILDIFYIALKVR